MAAETMILKLKLGNEENRGESPRRKQFRMRTTRGNAKFAAGKILIVVIVVIR